jgi:hypothetical protein
MIYRTLQGSDLFDKTWYRATQLSALEKLVDPIWHYLDTGWKKGLNPSPRFNTNYYLRTNPDVQDLGLNPLFHYLKYGIGEHRHPVATSLQELERLEPSASALRLITVPGGSPARLSMVIDDHTPRDSAIPHARILLAGLELARSHSVRLRVIDRRSAPEDLQITAVTSLSTGKTPVEYIVLGATNEGKDLPAFNDEIFVATSWSSAEALVKSLDPTRVRYIVSDDELRLQGDSDSAGAARSMLATLSGELLTLDAQLMQNLGTKTGGAPTSLNWTPDWGAKKSRKSPTPARKTTVTVDLDVRASGHRVRSTLAALSAAVAEGILDPTKHEVVILSPSTKPINLVASLVPQMRQASSLAEVLNTAGQTNVLITLARPSCLGVLEHAVLAHGGTVVSRYSGKTAGLSTLISVEPSMEAILDALREALAKPNG